MVILLKILLKPKKYWPEYIKSDVPGIKVFIYYAPVFALIGPFLSYFSLTASGYSSSRAVLYSITTYILDLAVVFIFSCIFSKISRLTPDTVLKIYTAVNIPIWLSDVVDIYQPARILSNIGFIYSFYLLWVSLQTVNKSRIFIHGGFLHLFLYAGNAVISELIATNPLILKLISN